ncbi:hypothetical protein ABFS82_12G056300 [Erythranthe guttata]|uniref:HNH domain-containing protein n=1 Tax=Erythranthe guttata TaxID=4155 RepID=A0A022RKJ8_ERYGU|nr:PREDICTED: uncharacterized protein LOC105955744 [Erythranthe guttata]EYU39415.1 hypothetical protein MIMGU_mgv1a012575mg [Erythranthe guttata]|eukprot:XP_012834991.1 PREDICTED: uncharacterized protein LOC105955744 [Erythranthe guttata]
MGVLHLHHLCSTSTINNITLPPSQLCPPSHFRCRRQIISAIIRRQLIAAAAAAAAISFSPLDGKALAGERVHHLPIHPSDSAFVLKNHGGSKRRERPRLFDSKAKRICWEKARQVPGRDPERWRMDAAGNIVCKNLHTCIGCLCYEYDHITPFSKGGESVEANCQILQTRVNRLKSDKSDIARQLLKGYSCDITFSDEQLDLIEMAVYGSVNRPSNHCIVPSISSFLRKSNSKDHNNITCNLPKND